MDLIVSMFDAIYISMFWFSCLCANRMSAATIPGELHHRSGLLTHNRVECRVGGYESKIVSEFK
jgi:hypothetical protein